MQKVKKFAVSIILTVICLFNIGSASDSLYETELIFYHEQLFPKNFYWIIMESEYQGEQVKSGTDKLLSEIKKLKQIIDEHNNQKNQTIVLSQSSNKDIELLIGSDSYQQAFSNKITQKISEINRYELTLGTLDIHLNSPFSIHQQLFIRVPSKNKSQLTQLVDRIQSQFNGSETLRILSIQKGNINSYSASKMPQLFQKNVQQIIDEEKLTKSIQSQAQKHCHNLKMDLFQILSFNPLIDQELFNQTSTSGSQQTLEDTEQISYDEAYQIVSSKQFYDYQNVFYQVKAICKGKNKPEKMKQTKINTKIQKKQKKVSNKNKIQMELDKLNEKLKNQKLF